MFTIQWRLALVIAAILPVFFAVVWMCRRSMSEASKQVKQKTAVINAGIESGISGIRTAKAFANEQEELEKFNDSNNVYKTSKREFHKAMGRFNAVMEFFLCILSAAVITVGGFLIMRGQMNTVDLITFSLYIATFVNPVRRLSNFSELLANGTAGFGRFLELMRTEPQMKDAPDAAELRDVKGQVDVDHVSFAYEGDLAVLHDVDLHVGAGETLAVVGPSGGGKSTLCQLIPRFYDVTEGSIRIDGQDVRHVTQRSLRQQVGVVQQDVFLFADSILNNIRCGKPDATEEEVVRAAKLAGLDTVPCLQIRAEDQESALLALIENIQRKDLHYFEEAAAIAAYLRQSGVTQEEAAALLGRSPSALANKLRLLRLSPDCRSLLVENGLSERHARALLRLDDPEERLSALRHIIRAGLNVALTGSAR